MFEADRANLHCANQVHVRIDRNDVAHARKPPRKGALPVIAVAMNEDLVNDTARKNGNQNLELNSFI